MENNKKLMDLGFPNLKRYIYNTTPVLKAKGTNIEEEEAEEPEDQEICCKTVSLRNV